mgnify:FL=1
MSQLKTVYLDPEHHSTNKTEFRLHGRAYLSDLKLLLNATSVGGLYSQSAGVYGAIKHIRLLSAGVELDSCRFANYLMAFKNLNNSNKDNINLRKRLTHNGLGYELDEGMTFGARDILEQTATSTAESEAAGVLYLSEILPVLNELVIINTDSVFPNLRIVIEYNNNDKLQKDITTNASTLSEPILMVSEVLSQSDIDASAKLDGLEWDTMEVDQIIIPAVTAGDTQHVIQKLNGFDNKTVSRMLMIKQTLPLEHNYETGGVKSLGFGVYNSFVQYKEKVNFNINSKPVFQNPLEEPGQKAQLLHDTWGKVNILPYANVGSQGLDKQGVVANNRVGVPDLQGNRFPSFKVGTQDFIAFACSKRVNNLELDYQRVGPTDAGMDDSNNLKAQNDSLMIRIYGEVRKQISLKNGKILVSYA